MSWGGDWGGLPTTGYRSSHDGRERRDFHLSSEGSLSSQSGRGGGGVLMLFIRCFNPGPLGNRDRYLSWRGLRTTSGTLSARKCGGRCVVQTVRRPARCRGVKCKCTLGVTCRRSAASISLLLPLASILTILPQGCATSGGGSPNAGLSRATGSCL
jgi:hypothetical protein